MVCLLRRQVRVFAVMVGLIGASVARADIVLDQSSLPPSFSSSYAVSPAQSLAQGITVGVAGLLDEIDLRLYRSPGAPGNITLSILSFVNGAPDTDLSHALFTGTITAAQIPESSAAFPNTPLVALNVLAAGIAVTQGETLAIALSGTGNGAPPWELAADGFQSYNRGLLYSRAGTTGAWSSATNVGSSIEFQTFVLAPNQSVPEPSSLVLLSLTGAIGLGVTGVRRRVRP